MIRNLHIIELPLIVKNTGLTHPIGGLNWGQRPGRNPNQAYIPVPAPIGRSGFFPDRPKKFNVITDDGQSFVMVRQQVKGKGITTPNSNATIGEYFRRRIGVPSGQYVTRADLDNYGRTDVTFIKVNEKTFFLYFGV